MGADANFHWRQAQLCDEDADRLARLNVHFYREGIKLARARARDHRRIARLIEKTEQEAA